MRKTEVLCATFRCEKSRNGAELGELKSGLQKYVRRGMSAKALWCAGELLSFREAPEEDGRKRVQTNFRHRLMIIFLEDVGDIGMWGRIDALRSEFADKTKVHEWVSLMSSASKSRACSHARAVASIRSISDKQGLQLAKDHYPSIAALYTKLGFDPRHNQESRWREGLVAALRAKLPIACFWAWAIQTEGHPRRVGRRRKPVWQIFQALEAAASPAVRRVLPIAMRWYKELQNNSEGFLCWMLPLLAHVCEHPFDHNELNYIAPKTELFAVNTAREIIQLDSFVYDIHTGCSKRGGLVRFATEGSYVANESAIVDLVWKSFYEDRKRVADGIEPLGPPKSKTQASPRIVCDDSLDDYISELYVSIHASIHASTIRRETDYDFIVRAQINTSRGKTDVYFAHPPDDAQSIVVVKGPFAKHQSIKNSCAMNAWKKKHGLPSVSMRSVLMRPDRWPEGVPLGIRNRLPRDKAAWFLVADSLVQELPRRKHQSKVWPETEVVDWGRLGKHVWSPLKTWDASTEIEKLDYCLALMARFVIGIKDLADRNFVRANGRLYSVDEDARAPENDCVDFYTELRKNKAALVSSWLDDNWDIVCAKTAAWSDSPSDERLKCVKTKSSALSLFVRWGFVPYSAKWTELMKK